MLASLMAPILKVSGLFKFFETSEGKVPCLRDVGFHIDEGEFAEVLKMYGHSDNASIKAFRKLCVVQSSRHTRTNNNTSQDENGKQTGKVSYGDFVRLWKDYFTSTNPDSPGNYLFGLMA